MTGRCSVYCKHTNDGTITKKPTACNDGLLLTFKRSKEARKASHMIVLLLESQRQALSVLLSRYIINEATGCWEWHKPFKVKRSYVTYKRKKRALRDKYRGLAWSGSSWPIHRLSVLLRDGAIDMALQVCHKCDNPCCMRPDHLFTGTYMDNVRDKVGKNRQSRSGRKRTTRQ
jgi:hypothetical protein